MSLSRDEWAAAYAAGASLHTVAKAAGTSHTAVRIHLIGLGVPRRSKICRAISGEKRGRYRTSSWHEAALLLRADGWTLARIGAEFGVTGVAVAHALRRRASDG